MALQTHPSSHHQNIAFGITCMVVASMFLPLMGTTAKTLGVEHVVFQIVWARYTGHFVYMSLIFLPSRGLNLYRTSRWRVQLLRSLLLLTSTCCFFTALQYISLPMATAINFIAPLMVTALAGVMLGEKVGPRRWAAVLIGFCGALVIIRPGLGQTHWAAGLVVVTAACWALYQLLTRRVSDTDSPETSVTYTAMVGCLVLSVAMFVMPHWWKTPETPLNLFLFFAIGVIAAAGHYLVVKAYQNAPASVVSPFNFLQLLGATVISYVFFKDIPDRFTWLGAFMIVGASLYVSYRERQKK